MKFSIVIISLFILMATSCAPMDSYKPWSINFADVTDLAAAGINAYDASAAIDTTNVNSGGKSIKVKGTIGSRGSCLFLSFGFWGVVGQDSVDLSGKTLSLEIYLPADSPIYSLFIHVFRGDEFVIVRNAHVKIYKGQWHTYTVDLWEDITLKTWRTYSNFTSPGLTDAQAVDVIKNAQSIAIVGVVQGDHVPAESYFLVDRMGWEPAGPAPAYDASVDSLRTYAQAKNLPMGGFMEPDGAAEPDFLRNLVQEFNTTLAWSYFPATEPTGGGYTFDEGWNPTPYADVFNESYDFKLLRYAGGGSNIYWIPDWLPGKSYAEALTILEKYTDVLVGHYKGKTYIWLLFNELLRYDLQTTPFTGFGLKDRNQPAPYTWGNNYSPWSSSPSDVTMIEEAFHVARAADPSALLFDNEAFSAAEGTKAGEAQYNLAAQMKADGTPIDGVGFQCHIILDQAGNFHQSSTSEPVLDFDPTYGFTDIAANVERYAALGLKVAFTEVDVSIYLADIDTSTSPGQALLAQRRQLQAEAYQSLLHIALTHPNVVAFNMWNWADEYTWTDETNPYAPAGFGNDLGLFDWFYQKKPAYDAMLDELKATQLPLPGPFDKVSPAEGTTEQPTSPTLSWEASTGATSCEYCIDSSNNNGCDTSWISTGTSTSVTTSGLLPLTTYFWQVRAKGDAGVTHANSGTWGSFTTVTDWSRNIHARQLACH
jgi:GH35 family endo-1,4-beta-xylanase